MITCPACGNQPSHTVEQYHYRESGLNNVTVTGVSIFRCKCGQEYVQLPGAQRVHDQVALALLNKPSLLTGQESKFLRKWLRLTSEEMASALGYTRVTASRWENDGPSVKTDRAIRLYASAVRSIAIDFESLFSSMNTKPQKHFKIVVDCERAAFQYPYIQRQTLNILSATTSFASVLNCSFVLPEGKAGTPTVPDMIQSQTERQVSASPIALNPVLSYRVILKPTDLSAERPNEGNNNDLALAA